MADHDTHDHTGIPGVGGGAPDIDTGTTAEMDDTLRLAPDGAGGVEWAAGGSSGGVDIAPSHFKTYSTDAQNTATWAKTITAVPTSRRLIVCISSYARDVNTPTLTNVTFTEVLAANFAGQANVSIYLGVPSSTSGTTLGITATGSNWIIVDIYEIFDVLTGSVITSATLTNTDAAATAGTPIGPITVTPGDFYAAVVGQNDGTTGLSSLTISAANAIKIGITPGSNSGIVSAIGRAGNGILTAVYAGGTSGGDMASGIVTFS